MLQFSTKVRSQVSRLAGRMFMFMVAVVSVIAGASSAFATTEGSTIGDIGVDGSTLVTDAGTAVGTLMLNCIGLGLAVGLAWLAYRLIKRFWK